MASVAKVVRWAGAATLALHACGGGTREEGAGVVQDEVVVVEPAIPTPEPAATSPDVPPDVGTVALPEPEPDPLHDAVRPGDSLSAVLGRAGLDGSTAARVSIALSEVMDPATIRAGQRYDIELADDGSLQRFAFRLSKTRTAVVTLNEEDLFEATVEEQATTVRTETIVGEVKSSLWAALVDQGHDPALVDVIVDVFAWDIDFFSSTREGDIFRLSVERHEIDGEFVRYGRVLAGEYAGKAAEAQLLWWEDGEAGRYVDAEGRGVERTLLKTPLKYARVSSGFNPARMHPVLHRVKSHKGVDYAAPEGAPVWAAADGTITFRAKQGGAGNLVVIRHTGGLTTLYMHLSKFADGQKVGQAVKAKTVIGYVGSTGLATGPHLHFGVKKKGRYVDPQTVESARGPGVPKAKLRAFERQRDAAFEQLETLTP